MLSHHPMDPPRYPCPQCERLCHSLSALHAHWLAWHDGRAPVMVPHVSRVPELTWFATRPRPQGDT